VRDEVCGCRCGVVGLGGVAGEGGCQGGTIQTDMRADLSVWVSAIDARRCCCGFVVN
jgi:hypothetical protein